MKFLCEHCKAKYQIADEKVAGRTVRMKCRKCGNPIEVRAAVTETSVSTHAPPEPGNDSAGRGPSARPGPKAGASGGGLATNLSSARPSAPRAGGKSQEGGALAGAFQRNVQKDEEISVALDLRELSAADEWYVAINGVPVGPVRVAELRRKAALGVVTDDSLVWQEGMEEWRPVRAVTDLSAVVREAASGGRVSLVTPPPPATAYAPDVRTSANPPGPRAPPARAAAPVRSPPGAPRPASPAHSPAPPAARSNVVPFAARVATAEKFENAIDAVPSGPEWAPLRAPTSVGPSPLVSPDPFGGVLAGPSTALAMPSSVAPPAYPIVAGAPRKSPPYIVWAMLVLAGAFGITAAFILLLKPAPPPQVVVVPSAPPSVTTSSGAAGNLPATAPADIPSVSVDGGATKSGAVATRPNAGAGPAAHPTGPTGAPNPDLQSLIQGAAGPGGGPGAPSAGGGPALTESQVTSVIMQRKTGVTRTCWERAASGTPSANVQVNVVVAASGQVQSAQATGNDPVVSHCVESAVRAWQFPASGGTSTVTIPFHFLRQ